MKRITKCMTTAAAVLLVTVGAASAQSLMKAEVPFAFSVGNKVMEPGTIQVRLVSTSTGNGALIVNNYDTKHGYVVLPKSIGDAPKQWISSGRAKLGFDCTSGVCVLARVWTGSGHAYEFQGPKARSGEMLLTEIVMKPDKGD